jgi:fumarate hydratase class I
MAIKSDDLVELYRKAATELPPDVKKALASNDNGVIKRIWENIDIAGRESIPVCQDTGTPHFFVKCPPSKQAEIKKAIMDATKKATDSVPLRNNAVDTLTGKPLGNTPVIYFEDSANTEITLLLKGGGCENIGVTYSLPNAELKAERDLGGVRNCIIDAVFRAQARGCPPYIIGVGVGSPREATALLSKKQLLREIHDVNPSSKLDAVEKRVLHDVNRLGIGPMGLGGNPTALAVKIGIVERHPASYFVDVSFSCWADRRATLRL